MDPNEFSFEALFSCSEFKRYTSPSYKEATAKFYNFLGSKFSDFKEFSDIESEANKYSTAAQESGFEQGFRFAVKLLRNLYDMSFPMSRQ